jgi:NAD(P)-dependent dehydrogenase (short-subunit alcohol dehydrogenase family)
MTNLTGKTALVTGAAGHLGTAMATCLARAGANLIAVGRSPEKLDKLRRKLSDINLSGEIVSLDLNDHEAVKEKLAGFNDIDIIVNNAYSGGSGTCETSAPDDFRKSYDVSVVAAQVLFSTCLPQLRRSASQKGYASVINIASMYGVVAPNIAIYSSPEVANPPFYGAAKAALLQWTKYAACEFAHEGIRINAISPGPFPNLPNTIDAAEFTKKLIERVPMGRVGTPKDIEGPLLFLASEQSSFVTGTNLIVDGGWTCW